MHYPTRVYPTWSKFPFCGFFAMMASLLTLLVDFMGTQYYERKQGLARTNNREEQCRVGSEESGLDSGIVPVVQAKEWNGKVFGEEEGGGMHIVGICMHMRLIIDITILKKKVHVTGT